MKTLSAGLLAHYQLKTTTLATCWKATLTNGTVVACTALDHKLAIDGVDYLSTASYNPTDIESTSELSPDNLEVEGFLASPAITDSDIRSGLWDYAAIELFEVNYNDLTMGRNVLREGTLGEVKGGRSKFTAELRGMMQRYSRNIVRLITKECPEELGSPKCGLDLADFTVPGTVDSVTENRVIADAGRTEATDVFAYGKMTFTSGLNNGLGMDVKTSSAGSIELHEQMPFVIAPGDTYTVSQGCPGRFQEDCKVRFNNGINFRGFPHLPQTDIYRVGGVP
ncbi:DUF2163 domain-containing protein [Variovorax paradoxus]|nr:DUF2163 domain-containing protein [Variovorax paradoxus]